MSQKTLAVQCFNRGNELAVVTLHYKMGTILLIITTFKDLCAVSVYSTYYTSVYVLSIAKYRHF